MLQPEPEPEPELEPEPEPEQVTTDGPTSGGVEDGEENASF